MYPTTFAEGLDPIGVLHLSETELACKYQNDDCRKENTDPLWNMPEPYREISFIAYTL